MYQLPLRSSGRFADLLQALDARKAALGLTHYAVSMPNLEEVFLKCTAGAHEPPPLEPAQQSPAASTADAAAPAGSPSDSACIVRVSPPRAGGSSAEKTRSNEAELAEAGSAASSAQGDTVHEDAERGASSAASSASVQGPGAAEGGGNASWQRQGSMSRDDSAKALNKVAVQGAGSEAPSSSSSSRRGSGEAPGEQSRAEAGETVGQGGAAAGEEAPLEEVPLHEPQQRPLPSRQRPRRQRRWRVAFAQMLRKRALVAGALPSSLFPSTRQQR